MLRSPKDYAILCEATETLPAPNWTFAGETFHAIAIDDDDGGVTIAIRGSESKPDWFVDFTPWGPSYYDHPDLGPIHSGFDDTTDECLPEIFKLCYGRKVRITGHSKGGSEGEVLTAKLAVAGITVDELVTFGTPRWIGSSNTKVDAFFKVKCRLNLSFRHFKDIVPQVPWWMRHPVGRDPIQVGSGAWWEPQLPYPGWVSMHKIANYVATVPAVR